MVQTKKIGILDLGLGNPQSISRMLNRCGFTSEMVTEMAGILRSDVLFLPGVGRFSAGMEAIKSVPGLHEYLKNFPREKALIGICLGMQMLFDRSHEDHCEGLALLRGEVLPLEASLGNRVPNMGWRSITKVGVSDSVHIEDSWKFYFTHSYAVSADAECCVAIANHSAPFAAVVKCNNIIGFQFHPEKSHQFGMMLLKSTLGGIGV